MIHRWWQLAIRNWRGKFARTLLYSIAVVVACALVVFLTTAFSTVEKTMWTWHERWVGRIDVQISARGDRPFPQEVLGEVQAVSGVRVVAARLQDPVQLLGPEGRRADAVLVGKSLPSDVELHPQTILAGRQLTHDDTDGALIEKTITDALDVGVGDTINIRVYDEVTTLRIVGVTDRPPLFSFIPSRVHVSLATAQKILDRPELIDRVYVHAASGVKPAGLADLIQQTVGNQYYVNVMADRTASIQKNLALWRASVFMLSGLAFVVAAFLIFATLACGLVQRTSEMGMLRCLGASRWHLAGLVVVESLPIGLWGAMLGVPIGLLASRLVMAQYASVFIGGWTISWGGLLLATVGAMGATIGGALLPAIAASRTSPMAASKPRARVGRWPAVAFAALAGTVMLAQAIIWMHVSQDPATVVYGHVLFGMPMMVIGLFLVTPAVLITVGRVLAWGVGAAMGLGTRLVAGELLRTRWRSSAIAASVSLCVALVVSANTQTESLIAGWKLPTGFPDLMVMITQGVGKDKAVQEMEGLNIDRWTGFNAFDVRMLGVENTQPAPTLLAMRGGNTWFFSLDPAQLNKVVEWDFEGGEEAADKAVAALSDDSRNALIVPAAFARARDKDLGDTIQLLADDVVDFEIVGVFESLSLETVGANINLNELLLLNTSFMVVGSAREAYEFFNQAGYAFLLIDVPLGTTGDEIADSLRKTWPDKRIQHQSLRKLKEQIDSDFRGLTHVFSLIGGILAAAVASVGVAVAMQANVFSRRRELGILHAVGMTRWQLTRLILGEGITLGTVGAFLGFLTGLYAAQIGLRINQIMVGGNPRFTVPTAEAVVAILLAMGVTLVSSVLAAYNAGRANVLHIMQE